MYGETKDFQNAALYKGKYITLRDSLYSYELTKFLLLTLIFFQLSRQRKNMNVLLDRRVEERTQTLEKALNDLHRNHAEHEILLYAISTDMNASVATIRGLCALSFGLEDRQGANLIYAKRFEETARRILEIAKRVQRKKK